ncbi:uncharacterized protein LOC128745436 [Sabethes cyaneus]|uniref:uncharacterized protein LOC128745436 n=1 Tax=Sabethes cyaneus TaxID=53552 RepID=UPI00237E6C55|nr:uncharacterized protein LOC128745436 [Sabethes cyaneus]
METPGPSNSNFQSVASGEYPCNSFSPNLCQCIANDDVLIYYRNAGGMNSNVNDYFLAASEECYDIIVLTETWLGPRTHSCQVFGPEFEVFRCDRGPGNSRKSAGGGVLVAVNKKLESKAIENDQWSSIEQVWVCIELANSKLFVCGIYIPPDRVRDDALIDVHSRSVMSVIDVATATDELTVIGDFNLPGLLWQPFGNGFLHPDPDHFTVHLGASRLLDCYSSVTLRQINHVTNENNRNLDLCFVSVQDVASVISLAPSPLVKLVRHHPPFILALHDHHSDHRKIIPPVSYDFRNADHRSIAKFFATTDWIGALDGNDADNAALTLSHIIGHAIDRHVPNIVHSPNSKPWLIRELRILKTEKRAALRTYSKFRTLSLREHYIRLNAAYKRTSRECYRRHLHRFQRNLKLKPKTFWKYVSDQRKESGLPSTMTLNGEVASDPQYISQLYADKFGRTFCDEVIPDDQATNNVALVTANTLGTFNIDETMISRAASTLKSSNKAGPDAHMFPVHKKGNRKDINNYRGISSLCAISKLLELVIMTALLSHCKQYLSDDQHGFIAGRSTTTNLMCLTSYIAESLADRAQMDVICTDLSAAFDKINHAIAIAKLERLGISANVLRWYNSYLVGRKLIVTVEGFQSNAFSPRLESRKAVILGPLIFLLYCNDVNHVLEGPRLSYADDLKIYLKIRSNVDAIRLQRELDTFIGVT